MLRLIFILVIFVSFHSAFAADYVEMLKKAIKTSTDNTELALLYKKLGDYNVSQEDYNKASDAYMKALNFARDVFTIEERIKIAVYLSWADRLDEAIEELTLVISEVPSNLDARIKLSRILSWDGRSSDAIEQVDRVLKESPNNKDALLVKANALRWKGDFKTAMPIYEKLLEKEEDFDARLGLTYALLSSGNIKDAQESYRLLKPKYAYHERELKKLTATINRATKPHFDIRYSYYNDSDDNRFNRYSLSYGFWKGNLKIDLKYLHTDAQDNTIDARAEDLSFNIYSKIIESLGIGGGLSFNQVGNSRTKNFLTWNMKADANTSNGTIGISIARNVFAETAQLIENRIRMTNTSVYISQYLTDKLFLYGSYNHNDYSDKNKANVLQFVSKYPFYVKNPRITLGYRFRYLDFKRQSRGGYFDPDNFISHQIFGTLYYKKEKFYSSIEPFIGHQSFKRYEEKNHDLFGGAYGTLGFKLTNDVLFEVNAEGGNYAMETAAGFKYYLIGIRLFIPILNNTPNSKKP